MQNVVIGLICVLAATSIAGCEQGVGDEGDNRGTSPTQAATAPLASSMPADAKHRPQRPSLSDEDLERERLAVEPDVDPAAANLELMWVKGNWAVWRWRALIESTRLHRGQRWFYKTYLQRLDEKTAKFVVKYVGPPFGPDDDGHTMAVTDDGTLITRERYDLVWRSRDGRTTRSEKIPYGWFERIDADGALWQLPSSTGENGKQIAGAFRFLPFVGTTFDPRNFVELAPAGVDNLLRGRPARYRNEFAWSQDRTVHFVDIKTGKRRTLELKGPQDFHVSHFAIRLFDDKVIAGPLHCFDAATGEMLGERDPNKSERRAMGMFTSHDGLGYYFDLSDPGGYYASCKIRAADPRAKAFEFTDVAPILHRPVGQDANGLLLWSGTEWKHVPWVKGK